MAAGDDDLVFPNYPGDVWSEDDRRVWTGRRLRPALKKAGITDPVRQYDLRPSYVSMQIASGLNAIEVARRAGHSASMTLDVYGHVFQEWEGKGPIDLAEEIRRARRAA